MSMTATFFLSLSRFARNVESVLQQWMRAALTGFALYSNSSCPIATHPWVERRPRIPVQEIDGHISTSGNPGCERVTYEVFSASFCWASASAPLRALTWWPSACPTTF